MLHPQWLSARSWPASETQHPPQQIQDQAPQAALTAGLPWPGSGCSLEAAAAPTGALSPSRGPPSTSEAGGAGRRCRALLPSGSVQGAHRLWPRPFPTSPIGDEAREELQVPLGSAGPAVQTVLPPRAGGVRRPHRGDLPAGLGEAAQEGLPPHLPRSAGELRASLAGGYTHVCAWILLNPAVTWRFPRACGGLAPSCCWWWWWCSVSKLCLTLCDPMDCSTSGEWGIKTSEGGVKGGHPEGRSKGHKKPIHDMNLPTRIRSCRRERRLKPTGYPAAELCTWSPWCGKQRPERLPYFSISALVY